MEQINEPGKHHYYNYKRDSNKNDPSKNERCIPFPQCPYYRINFNINNYYYKHFGFKSKVQHQVFVVLQKDMLQKTAKETSLAERLDVIRKTSEIPVMVGVTTTCRK